MKASFKRSLNLSEAWSLTIPAISTLITTLVVGKVEILFEEPAGFDNEGLAKTNEMMFEFTRIDTELYKYLRSCVFVSEVIPAML